MTERSMEKGAPGLVADALTHVSNLVRNEVNLARAEVSENVKSMAVAVGMLAASLVIAIVALNVLAAALVAAITNMGIDAGWSALIVGVLFAVIAFALASKGMNDLKIKNLAPTRTATNVRRDAEAVKEAYNDKR
ncbi:MAG: phage holin family protein [Nitratireductor sp.]|nr:phage holin family protein [Nitratireductor sp.]